MTAAPLETTVQLAQQGDAAALEAVVRAVQKDVRNLALRMLWCPHDAADATQEILLKVVTRLATFEGRSAFRTWVFRVAMNHLLNQRASRMEAEGLTFESFAQDLSEGLSDPGSQADDPEYARLVQEVRIGCSHAMLTCLDREHRAAFVLGDILEMSSQESAQVLGIGEPAFRKRLSRARQRIVDFMTAQCGWVGANATCRCEHRVEHAQTVGIVRRDALLFAREQHTTVGELQAHVAELSALQRAVAVYRSHPRPDAPGESTRAIEQLLVGTALRCMH